MLLRKKEEIKTWLNQYQIKDYDLIKDEKYGYVVNVNNHVNLYSKKLKSINVKFNEVTGYFDCSFNELETLEGCPEIVAGYFGCRNNYLKSLKGSPKIVKMINCSCNNLMTLEGCPEIVGEFILNDNNLSIESLNYLPKKINEKIYLKGNKKLGELQEIINFNELKEKVKILLEKENLLNIINEEKLNIKNSVNKI